MQPALRSNAASRFASGPARQCRRLAAIHRSRGEPFRTADSLPAGWPGCRDGERRVVGLLLAAMLAVGPLGCKSGSSMGGSWWTLGMGGPDAATLAEAPPFEGDLTKPSATATPYPTTSTPEGYALAETGAETGQPKAGQPAPTAVAATPPAPVTYGSTPPAPAGSPPAVNGKLPADRGAVAAMTPATGAAPQVGPYQTVPTPPPAAASSPGQLDGLANRAAGESGLPQPASRFSPPPAPAGGMASSPATGPATGSSRFSSIADQRVATAPSGSRFSSPPAAGSAPLLPARGQPAAESSSGGSATGRYGEATASAFSAGQSAATPPAGNAFRPTQSPAVASPAFPANSGSREASPSPTELPAAPTSRRRDPGYRPGGTSSYRLTEPVYAETGSRGPASVAGSETIGAGVTPAAFEAATQPGQTLPPGRPTGLPAVTSP